MQSKIRRQTPSGRPSRIRRDPVRLEVARPLSKAELEKIERKAREREVWGGVAGVALFGLGIAALAIVVATVTLIYERSPGPAPSARFDQCYSAAGPNCVADGNTIRVHGEQVTIAGIAVPQIADAQCGKERSRGIDAAIRLADLLNGGKITIGRAFRDDYGREVRKVAVDGDDVGNAMIDAGVAREFDGSKQDWCATSDDDSSGA